MNPSTLRLLGGTCIHAEAYKTGLIAIFQQHGRENLETLVIIYEIFESQIEGYSWQERDTSNLNDAIALARGEIDHYLRDVALPCAIDADISDQTGGTHEAAIRLLLSEG